MRKFLCLFFFSLGLSLTAQAQTVTQEKAPEKGPTKETSKPVQPEAKKEAGDGIDLDRFFKQGEENARNGASCDKPATPADPIA